MAIEFNSIEEMKAHIILGIFSKEKESFEMSGGPSLDKGGFSLRPLLVSEKNSSGELYSFYVVEQEIMDKLEMTEEEILQLARKNSVEKYPGEMKAITEFINVTEQMMIPDGVVIPQIYVLSNENYCCGAAAMFYQPELLDNLSKLTGKDLAVFPADMNCVYCVPVSNKEQIAEYQEMYKMAIEGMESALSDNVLHYDMANRQLKDMAGNVIEAIQQQQMTRRTHSGR